MKNLKKNKSCAPLKIAFLGHKNCLERSGGVEVVVYELATRMAAIGHDITCYNRNSRQPCNVIKPKAYKGVRLKYVPTLNKRGLAAATSSICAAVCAAIGRFDVVHFHAEGPAAMCWLPKFFGKKVVVTIHGLDWKREKWGPIAGSYIMLGEKCAVKYADEIIVLSPSMQRYFLNTYGRNTVYIPNGVTKPKIRNVGLIKDKFGLEKEGYILFLGRLVPEKGLTYLIQAFKQVRTSKKLVIAGASSDTDNFVNALKHSAQSDRRIIFTDFVQGQILEELYSNAYIYVLPSDLEGMPLGLLEAMSFGNCCVVSDIPECTGIVGDKALCFHRGNVDELANCLQKLCDEESLVHQYKAQSSDFICSAYNWEDIAAKTIAVYNNQHTTPDWVNSFPEGMHKYADEDFNGQ